MRKQAPNGQFTVTVGDGLFSSLSYKYDDVIATFKGVWRSQTDMDEMLAIQPRRGAYCLRYKDGLILDCYDTAQSGECLASKANDPRNCIIVSTQAPAEANCRMVPFTRKTDGEKFIRLKAGPKIMSTEPKPKDYILPAGEELLVDYGEIYQYFSQ